MSYQSWIMKDTGCDAARAEQVEDLMRLDEPTGCLDGMTRGTFREKAITCNSVVTAIRTRPSQVGGLNEW